VAFLPFRLYGHEVQHLRHPLRREKPGQKHVCVRQIKLLAASVLQGLELKVAALLVVQDGTEDARGIESGQTQPVYRPLRADERCRVQIAYHPVILYRQITHAPPF
jgi:hypothetical protein